MKMYLDMLTEVASAERGYREWARTARVHAYDMEANGREAEARASFGNAAYWDERARLERERMERIKTHAMEWFERRGAVRVTDLRTGDHDRHEIRSAAE